MSKVVISFSKEKVIDEATSASSISEIQKKYRASLKLLRDQRKRSREQIKSYNAKIKELLVRRSKEILAIQQQATKK